VASDRMGKGDKKRASAYLRPKNHVTSENGSQTKGGVVKSEHERWAIQIEKGPSKRIGESCLILLGCNGLILLGWT
jgi:hypothetical protein